MSEEKEIKLDKEGLKKDLIALATTLFAITIILKIVFYKEETTTVLQTAFAFFWTSTLPGFVVMEYWHEHLDVLERIVIGTVIGFALTGIPAYYLGLIGININSLTWTLPITFMVAGGIAAIWKNRKSGKKKHCSA